MPPPVLPPAGLYNPFKDVASRQATSGQTPNQFGFSDWMHGIITGIDPQTENLTPSGTIGSGRKMERGNPVDAAYDGSSGFPWKDIVVYGIAILFVVFGLKGVFK